MLMKNKIIQLFKGFDNIDKKIRKIMNYGYSIAITFGIFGIISLLIYKLSYISYDLIEASLLFFKTGLLFTVQIFACGYTANKLRSNI